MIDVSDDGEISDVFWLGHESPALLREAVQFRRCASVVPEKSTILPAPSIDLQYPETRPTIPENTDMYPITCFERLETPVKCLR